MVPPPGQLARGHKQIRAGWPRCRKLPETRESTSTRNTIPALRCLKVSRARRHATTCHLWASSSHRYIAHYCTYVSRRSSPPSCRQVRSAPLLQVFPASGDHLSSGLAVWPATVAHQNLVAEHLGAVYIQPPATGTAREPDTQIRRSRVVGADTRPCLRRRGAPCPVSRTSGPWADCSSVLVQSPPPWLLARRRGLFGFGPLSQYWSRLVAPVLDTPSVSHSRAQSYKYALLLYLDARELMPSVLPYSWSTPYIHQLDRLLTRQEAL